MVSVTMRVSSEILLAQAWRQYCVTLVMAFGKGECVIEDAMVDVEVAEVVGRGTR